MRTTGRIAQVPARCPTCKRKYKRSRQANARYWTLLHQLAERLPVRGQHYSAENWHRYFKSKFLGCVEHRMPNGKTVIEINSSADLDVDEFNSFTTKVEAFAAERDIYLEDMEAA